MKREELLLKYREEVQEYIKEQQEDLKQWYKAKCVAFQSRIKDAVIKGYQEKKSSILYIQISLLRCEIPNHQYWIEVTCYDENYFLDQKGYSQFFKGNELFYPLQKVREYLIKKSGNYYGKIEQFEIDAQVMQIATDFFKSLAPEYRMFFRDFIEWEEIQTLCNNEKNKIVIKWGFHQEQSETIYRKEYNKKSQEEFLEVNKNNTVKEWKIQDVYQSFDECEFKQLQIEMMNLFFSSYRKSSFFECTFLGILLYGATFYHATLEKVTFFHCDLSQADFRNCDLQQVEFIQCNLQNCDFENITFTQLTFHECEMKDAIFSREGIERLGLQASDLQKIRIKEKMYVFGHESR